MKALLVAASAFAMFASTSAMAAQGEIDLNATVAPQCGEGHHMSGADASPGWDQSDITVDLADANGQFNGETFTNRAFGNVWCNAPATVTLEVSALTTDVTVFDGDSFTNHFDIKVTTDAGVYVGQGSGYVIQSNDGVTNSVSGNTLGAFETGLQRYGGANSIEVLPSVRSGENRRPVAGDYTGYVRFTATVS